jgi:hypothetical protein
MEKSMRFDLHPLLEGITMMLKKIKKETRVRISLSKFEISLSLVHFRLVCD